ncbi:MAG: hypothetical protein K2N38_00670 [Oscillospiraceae bacterium]|nr:hypothetical protein [Oscillospiraceae bacterium]
MNETEIKGLLKEYSEILNTLYSAGIVRTYNSPVGDYAEWLVSTKLGLTLQKTDTSGYDAIGNDGKRYQIKGRWMHPGKNARQLTAIRDYDMNPFDYLVVVVFGMDFEVEEAYLIPYEIIGKYFPHNKHLNGIIVTLTNKFISNPQVKHIKEKLM